jgi:hypothetical protein
MKPKRAATKRESAWMGRVKGMRCICCQLLDHRQEQPTDVHHIREDREDRNNWLVLPLCWSCHQGPLGVHGDKSFLRLLQMSEWALLGAVLRELNPCR